MRHPFELSMRKVQLNMAGRSLLSVPDLQASGGTLLHLLGENGCGKTTFLRGLTGETPFDGEIRIGNATPGSRAAKAQTAYVATDASLLDDLTVQENLSFMAQAWSRPREELFGLASAFGLEPWLQAWPTQLSRGTRQKVALSIGLGLSLPLTLLDEPFGTLDAASREVLLETMREKVAAGHLLLVTTHGGELTGLPRRTLRIQRGTVVEA